MTEYTAIIIEERDEVPDSKPIMICFFFGYLVAFALILWIGFRGVDKVGIEK